MARTGVGEPDSLVWPILEAADRDPGRSVNRQAGVDEAFEGAGSGLAVRRF
jgi:hypothetical protein